MIVHFQVSSTIVERIKRDSDYICRFSCRNEQEKEVGLFNGKVSTVAGTHTHVQTVDEKKNYGQRDCLYNRFRYLWTLNGVIGSDPEIGEKAINSTTFKMK